MKTTRRFLTLLSLLMTLALLLPTVAWCEGTPQNLPRLEDDYYQAINAQWLDQTVIPSNRSRVNAFLDLQNQVRSTLLSDFTAMLASGKSSGDQDLDMFLAFFAMAQDTKKRNADGFAPAKADYERITSLTSVEDLSAQAGQWLLDSLPFPLAFFVMPALDDAETYGLWADSPPLFLQLPDYYTPDHPVGQRMLALHKELQKKLLLQTGISEEEALAEVEKACAFDSLLASFKLNAAEEADFVIDDTHVTLDAFVQSTKHLDLTAVVQSLLGTLPGQLNVENARFLKSIDPLFTPENFEPMKSWMKVNFLLNYAPYLSEDFGLPMEEYTATLEGAKELPPQAETRFVYASKPFEDVIGRYYGQTYLGAEAREEITQMVRDAVEVYRKRLQNNEWLGDETKEMAIRKLDAFAVRVGYPDHLPSKYAFYAITPSSQGGTFYSNRRALELAEKRDMFGQYGAKRDRNVWITQGHVVNAYYSPTDNSINFPAAILQAPFYSPTQSDIANLAGIGLVIGHEISHAFDATGANYDEWGNLENWWTQEDFMDFAERAGKMVLLFDGIPYGGSAIDGSLTLSENIADAGGFSCALEIAKSIPEADLAEFFEAFATDWRQKITPEKEALLLFDTHAPVSLRVNVQFANTDAFYEAYEIESTDGMYLPPEDRVHIW